VRSPAPGLRIGEGAKKADNRSVIETLLGFGIVTAFFLLGSFLHRLGLPIPGGVLGLILFFLALQFRLIKLKWVERAAGLLLRHMVLLFVPLTVGLMELGPLLSRQAVAITGSLLVSLVAVILTTGLLGRWLLPSVVAIVAVEEPVMVIDGVSEVQE
jgi:holin-like protein